MSNDIRDIFVWACSLINLPCKNIGYKNIYIYKKDYVNILEEFIGPKS